MPHAEAGRYDSAQYVQTKAVEVTRETVRQVTSGQYIKAVGCQVGFELDKQYVMEKD